MRLVIVEQPDLPASPVLVMRWSLEGGLGWLAKAASPALAVFQLLPPGIRIDGDLLGIDVAELLRSKDLGWVVPLAGPCQYQTFKLSAGGTRIAPHWRCRSPRRRAIFEG